MKNLLSTLIVVVSNMMVIPAAQAAQPAQASMAGSTGTLWAGLYLSLFGGWWLWCWLRGRQA